MHILVLGATGFIGRSLVSRLVDKNHTVYAHYRSKPPAPKTGVVVFRDYQDISLDQPIDVVINLAGCPIASIWTNRYKQKLMNSRVMTTRLLNAWLKKRPTPPKLVVAASAIGYYGSTRDGLLDEDTSIDPNQSFSSQLCDQWEKESLDIQSIVNRVVLLRLGVVLGKSGGMMEKLWWPNYLGLGSVIGEGRQILSWIHIHDVISAIEFILTHENLVGPVNLTAPNSVSQATFSKDLAAVMMRPLWLRIPSCVLHFSLGDMAKELLLTGAAVYPKKLEKAGFDFQFPKLTAALKDIVAGHDDS